MLLSLGYDETDAKRISYIVGHHHTYSNVVGDDYQILIEADFLVNFFEEKRSRAYIENVLTHIFKTSAGIALCKIMFGID